jgi:hypothetical protein
MILIIHHEEQNYHFLAHSESDQNCKKYLGRKIFLGCFSLQMVEEARMRVLVA